MKYSLKIDKDREEEILIFAHERNELTDKIEAIIKNYSSELIGYKDSEAIKLKPEEVFCFLTENGHTYALCDKGRYQIKLRLYQLEENFAYEFVKINQSCLVNVKMIESFKTSIGGSLLITLKGGYRDYVSRRQLKTVKKRIGL